MEHTLIVALFSEGVSQQAITFPNEAACEHAKELALTAFAPGVKAICVPNNVEEVQS